MHLVSVAVAVAFLAMPGIAASQVVNPGAEADGGWFGPGGRIASYGSEPTLPSTEFSFYRQYGERLFALEPAGRLEQVVDVSGWASGIDAGTTTLYGSAALGADAPAEGGARLTATPLAADGTQLAAPVVAGPPTRADRAERTLLVPCRLAFDPPPGTRGVQLLLEGVGSYHTATADAVSLTDIEQVNSGQLDVTPIGQPNGPGQGPGCLRWDPTPVQGPPSGVGAPPSPPAQRRAAIRAVKLTRRTLTVRATMPGALTANIYRRHDGRWRRVANIRRTLRANRGSFRVAPQRKGRARVALKLRTRDGQTVFKRVIRRVR